MSDINKVYDPAADLGAPCSCGQHASQSEHLAQAHAAPDAEALACSTIESAMVRALFPNDRARRRFLRIIRRVVAAAAGFRSLSLLTSLATSLARAAVLAAGRSAACCFAVSVFDRVWRRNGRSSVRASLRRFALGVWSFCCSARGFVGRPGPAGSDEKRARLHQERAVPMPVRFFPSGRLPTTDRLATSTMASDAWPPGAAGIACPACAGSAM